MRLVLLATTLAGCSYNPAAAISDGAADDGAADDGPMGDGDGPQAGPIVPSNHGDTAPLDAAGLPDLIMGNVAADGATVWRIYTGDGLIQREAAIGTFVTHRAAGFGVDPSTQLQIEMVGGFTVLYVDRLEVEANVSFEGHGKRPLIVIAKGTITIAGEIDVSGGFAAPGSLGADPRIGGPGGGDGARNTGGTDAHAEGCGGALGTGGKSAGVDTPGDDSGGGGGGGGLGGARGGNKAVGSDDGGPGGAACITVDLIPLIGGGGGGAGDTAGGGGDGGAGGGAIQLTSMSKVEIAGVIDAGGKGGFAQLLNDEGGGGGGGGGGILLEAPLVEITGVLAANGGGGGSGRVTSADGQQGTLTEAAALGGPGSGSGSGDGRGGDGGARVAAAQAGDDQNPGGGGGGGAAGVVRINVASGGLTLSPAAILSPAHSQGAVVFAP